LVPGKIPFGVRDAVRRARYDGANGMAMEEEMDAVTPKNESQAGVEGHSHVVRPAEM
jgi:hypothetical protein